MQAEIDRAAGIIWRYLNEHGEMTLGKLKQGTSLADQEEFHEGGQDCETLPADASDSVSARPGTGGVFGPIAH